MCFFKYERNCLILLYGFYCYFQNECLYIFGSYFGMGNDFYDNGVKYWDYGYKYYSFIGLSRVL